MNKAVNWVRSNSNYEIITTFLYPCKLVRVEWQENRDFSLLNILSKVLNFHFQAIEKSELYYLRRVYQEANSLQYEYSIMKVDRLPTTPVSPYRTTETSDLLE